MNSAWCTCHLWISDPIPDCSKVLVLEGVLLFLRVFLQVFTDQALGFIGVTLKAFAAVPRKDCRQAGHR